MPTVEPATLMWSRTISEAQVDENFRRLGVSFQQTYQIVTSYDATALDVYLAQGLPQVGEVYPGTNFVLAERCSLQKVSPILWFATCNYRGEIGRTFQDSPLNAKPIITLDDVETEAEVDTDILGRLIVNTAGDRISGVKALFPDQVLTVTRNFATFNSYAQAIYRRSVSSDVFFNWAAGTCKLQKYSAQNIFDQTLGYWKVTAVFQFRYPYNTTPAKAWYNRSASLGLMQIINGKKVPCTVSGEPATVPQPLDINGMQTDSAGVHWIETQLYRPLPYAALGML